MLLRLPEVGGGPWLPICSPECRLGFLQGHGQAVDRGQKAVMNFNLLQLKGGWGARTGRTGWMEVVGGTVGKGQGQK